MGDDFTEFVWFRAHDQHRLQFFEACDDDIHHFKGDDVSHQRPEGDVPVAENPAIRCKNENVDEDVIRIVKRVLKQED